MLTQNLNFDSIQRSSGLPIWHLYVQPVFFITAALKYVFPLAGILLLIYLILGGFSLMTSGGDPKAIESAKGKITNAIIGFVIIFVAYWLVAILARVLGLEGTYFGGLFGLK